MKTRVFGLFGLRWGLSRLWSGHPRVTVEQCNVLSLFRLCVAPGWFNSEGFALAEAYIYHGLFTYFWTDRIYTRYRCHVQGSPLASHHHHRVLYVFPWEILSPYDSSELSF